MGVSSIRAKDIDPKEIDAARLRMGRALARANREGETHIRLDADTVRLVLYGIVAAQADAAALRVRAQATEASTDA